MTQPLYAARLNAFKIGAAEVWPDRNRITIHDLIERAAQARVSDTLRLNAVDLNYPDHFEGTGPAELSATLDRHGMALNGLAMRYYTEPGFRLGAFTNPDRAVRQAAIDVTRHGLDALSAMGGGCMTLWLGQDGFDYAFQADYGQMWDDTVAALAEVADHAPDIDIAVEYKPNEPRAFALLPDMATTLLAIREAGRPNLGVTLDFAHVLYADEMPAFAARLADRQARLLGVHLNDGYAKRDDGLMVGSVHAIQTVELFVELQRMGWDGAIYFDTFPDHSGLDPVEEAKTNLLAVERLRAAAVRLSGNTQLADAIARQDAALSQRIVQGELFR